MKRASSPNKRQQFCVWLFSTHICFICVVLVAACDYYIRERVSCVRVVSKCSEPHSCCLNSLNCELEVKKKENVIGNSEKCKWKFYRLFSMRAIQSWRIPMRQCNGCLIWLLPLAMNDGGLIGAHRAHRRMCIVRKCSCKVEWECVSPTVEHCNNCRQLQFIMSWLEFIPVSLSFEGVANNSHQKYYRRTMDVVLLCYLSDT